MNTLVKIATISGILWVVCIIGTIVWSNATIEGDDDFDPKHLPSASWGGTSVRSLGIYIIYGIYNNTYYWIKRKKQIIIFKNF